jgi:hypothetical protein
MLAISRKPALQLVAGALAFALSSVSPASAKATAEQDRRAEIERRIERLEAIKAVERLQSVYGYYQDRFFFQEVATLFSLQQPRVQWGDNQWEGADAVSHFWTDYMRGNLAEGADGPKAGKLFDMPQWQGVITIAEDGTSARARYRTLGRLANYREVEYWISGVYENEYVLEDGVWKFRSLKFCPTWSGIYTDGWQNSRPETALAWLSPPKDAVAKPVAAADACPAGYPSGSTLPFHFVPSDPYATASGLGAEE